MKNGAKKFAGALLSASLIMGCVPGIAVFADTDGVKIDETNFPDTEFRTVVSLYDSDMNGILDENEIQCFTNLSIYDVPLTNLKGMEYLTALQTVSINKTKLTSLDLSSNPNVYALNCSDNQISSLNISKNNLSTLTCSNNKLTSLDLSASTSLSGLICNGNEIKTLDVSKCTFLESLGFSDTNVTSIDLSKNKELKDLGCDNTGISKLDLSNNPEIYTLSCNNTNITELDLSKNVKLGELKCSGNQFSKLDLSNNPEIAILDCSHNSLTSLDLTKLPKLYILYCDSNKLSSLDISNNPDLQWLVCHNNKLTGINIKNSENLVKAAEEGKQITYKFVTEHNGWAPDTLVTEYHIADSEENSVASYGVYYNDFIQVMCGVVITDKDVNLFDENAGSSSDSGVGGFVERLYTVAMDRVSDAEGKEYWTEAVKMEGKTGSELALSFLMSDEFLDKQMSDSELLDVLYETCFDREADDEGKNYWLGEMKSGAKTKEDVIMGFINSTEWADICLTYGILSGTDVKPSITVEPNDDVLGFAERLYTTCLNRDSEAEGLEFWSKEIANLKRSGSEAAKGFFFSEEIEKSGISDAEFLTRLYKTLMGREPEKEGFDFWLGQMKSGAMTRENVFDGFAASAEWAGICADAGILR